MLSRKMGGNYVVPGMCLVWLWCFLLFQQNSHQVDIKCIPLQKCSTAMKLISTKKYAPETINFLRTSHCGRSKKSEPLVWCPNMNSCLTPDNENGTCVDLNQCPSLLGRSASTADMSTYRCNSFLEDAFYVCCSNQEHQRIVKRSYEEDFHPQNLQGLGSKDYEPSGEMKSDHPRYPINPYLPHKKYPHSHGSIENRFNEEHLDKDSDHKNFPGPAVNRHNHENIGRTTPRSNDPGYWRTSIDMLRTSHEATTNSNMEKNMRSGTSTVRSRTSTLRSRTSTLRSRTSTLRSRTSTVRSRTSTVKSRTSSERSATTSQFSSEDTRSASRFATSSNNSSNPKFASRDPSPTSSFADEDDASSIPAYEVEDISSTSRTVSDLYESAPFENISAICGRQTANIDRIIGGKTVDLGEFPWMALLEYTSNNGRKFGCGGSLINKRYVLTAAHCVDQKVLQKRNLRLYRVLLGEYDTRNFTDCIYSPLGSKCADPPIYFGISSVLAHERFDDVNAADDVALLRLDSDVTFTDYIRPICLPNADFTMGVNESFTVAGWGKTSSTGEGSPVLLKTRLPLVRNSACERYGITLLGGGQVCAGVGRGVDTCTGDSGGPMMVDRARNFEKVAYMMGVVSYGLVAGCGNAPSVNTFLPPYVDWIVRNVR